MFNIILFYLRIYLLFYIYINKYLIYKDSFKYYLYIFIIFLIFMIYKLYFNKNINNNKYYKINLIFFI